MTSCVCILKVSTPEPLQAEPIYVIHMKLDILISDRDYFDWKNVAESLVIWAMKIGENYEISEDFYHFYCGESPQEGALLWAFLDRDHTEKGLLAELDIVWPRLVPGGILAGHDYRQASWPEVAPTVDAWAGSRGLEVHFVPPYSFWVQKPGGDFSNFQIWNQEILPVAEVENAFNPSICPHPTDSNKRLFVFRSTRGVWDEGRIWIGVLDSEDLQFIRAPNQLELEEPGMNCEDPRLFSFEREIWLGYTTSHWRSGPTISRLNLVPLEEVPGGQWLCADERTLFSSPTHREQEKNWIFFHRDEDLLVLYSASPRWRVHQLATDHPHEYRELLVAPKLVWPYGEIRGGTPFIDAPNGNLWTFFHSSRHHVPERISYYRGVFTEEICEALLSISPPCRGTEPSGRYFCGLLEVDRETLLPTRISDKPLLYQTPAGRGRVSSHVVWPAGAFREEDQVVLAYGLDDRSCHCARFSVALLDELLRPVALAEDGSHFRVRRSQKRSYARRP